MRLTRHSHEVFRITLLELLSALWADLPTFAVCADEFVFLVSQLVVDQPLWRGRPAFLRQAVEMLSSRMQALADHPNRGAYTALMRLIQPGNSTAPFAGACSDTDGTSEHDLTPHLPQLKSLASQLTVFPLELEPCLLCHREILEDQLLSVLRWDSSTWNWRRGNVHAPYSIQTHHARFLSEARRSSRLSVPMDDQQQDAQQQDQPQASNGRTTSLDTVKPMPLIFPEPHTWVSPNTHLFDLSSVHAISQISVEFTAASKSARFVRTLNIYSCTNFGRPPARLLQDRSVWNRVAQVHLLRTQRKVIVNLAPLGPQPLPEGEQDLASLTTSNAYAVVVGNRQGLPLLASCLIFEYADLHQSQQQQHLHGADSKKRFCTRCRAETVQGFTCQVCKQSGNQCARCHFINLSDEDNFLCTNCGYSNSLNMTFSIIARFSDSLRFILLPPLCVPVRFRPCYSAVEPLHDDEDRDAALARVVSLSEDLSTTSQNLTRISQMELSMALHDLTSTDARATPPSRPPADGSHPNVIGRVHPGLGRLAQCLSEAQAVSLDASITACRLWAMRQSVACYDAAQLQTSPNAGRGLVLEVSNDAASPGSSDARRGDATPAGAVEMTVEFIVLTSAKSCRQWVDLFGITVSNASHDDGNACKKQYSYTCRIQQPNLRGCYRCLLCTIAHSCALLQTVALNSPPVLKQQQSASAAPASHWLFQPPTTRTQEPLTHLDDVGLLKTLISNTLVVGLVCCPQTVQERLKELVISLTRDSLPLVSRSLPPLPLLRHLKASLVPLARHFDFFLLPSPSQITHMGSVIFDRLVSTARSNGEQAHLLPILCHSEITLLESSVLSILPTPPTIGSSALNPSAFDRRKSKFLYAIIAVSLHLIFLPL
ncbi:unnamed protein product [Schistocephalus solidus]|uniref:Phorbol-ester/DAG-type domain-containing protein n=1 Tax=Schistocephalus solidus TaxID=70667 RepID=A0A183TM32_SCHSO|nr:unnamed protein product [Schistocephalus solidus]